VFNEQDGNACLIAQPFDQSIEFLGLLWIHPGRGFIQKQQKRVRSQGARDLEPALFPVCQFLGKRVHPVLELKTLQEPIGSTHGIAFLVLGPSGLHDGTDDAGLGAAVPGHHDVLQGRHVREQADILKGARQPFGRDTVGFQVVDAFRFSARTADEDIAARGLIDTGDAVEKCGLPGAVRSDQGHDLTRIDGKIDAVQGQQTAEFHAQGFDVENRGHPVQASSCHS